MIIDYRNRDAGGTWATHVAVCGYTGQDLSGLRYFYADDEAGLLKVNLVEKRSGRDRAIMADPVTGHRTAGLPTEITTADGEILFDYGDGYVSPREPEIATAEIRRHIVIVPRPPVLANH